MNNYAKIGILTIVIGILMTSQLLVSNKIINVLGGIINGVGLYLITKGSLIGSKKDKAEIIEKITDFKRRN